MAGEALWRPRRQCDSSRVAQPGLSALKQTVRSPSLANLMAEELGFEPRSSVLETDSLPLLLFLCGRRGTVRTCDLVVMGDLLYRLSYAAKSYLTGGRPHVRIPMIALPL